MMQLALYRGPGTDLTHRLGHLLTVAVLSVRALRWCPYSHAELVIDGVCYSSSVRDGGVRAKNIDLDSGHWDVLDMPGDEALALRVFDAHKGFGYDWPGAIRWGLPFIRQRKNAVYCFELIALMLDLHRPADWGPLDLMWLSQFLQFTKSKK